MLLSVRTANYFSLQENQLVVVTLNDLVEFASKERDRICGPLRVKVNTEHNY